MVGSYKKCHILFRLFAVKVLCVLIERKRNFLGGMQLGNGDTIQERLFVVSVVELTISG